jgi:hypothetical protein
MPSRSDGIEATVDRLLRDDVIDIDTHRSGGPLELGAALQRLNR